MMDPGNLRVVTPNRKAADDETVDAATRTALARWGAARRRWLQEQAHSAAHGHVAVVIVVESRP